MKNLLEAFKRPAVAGVVAAAAVAGTAPTAEAHIFAMAGTAYVTARVPGLNFTGIENGTPVHFNITFDTSVPDGDSFPSGGYFLDTIIDASFNYNNLVFISGNPSNYGDVDISNVTSADIFNGIIESPTHVSGSLNGYVPSEIGFSFIEPGPNANVLVNDTQVSVLDPAILSLFSQRELFLYANHQSIVNAAIDPSSLTITSMPSPGAGALLVVAGGAMASRRRRDPAPGLDM